MSQSPPLFCPMWNVERGMRNWRQVTDDNKLQSKTNRLLKGSKYRPKQQKDLTPIYRLHILDLVNLFLVEDFFDLAGVLVG